MAQLVQTATGISTAPAAPIHMAVMHSGCSILGQPHDTKKNKK
jgi:hypothetical protein